jgi:hypothetical protein
MPETTKPGERDKASADRQGSVTGGKETRGGAEERLGPKEAAGLSHADHDQGQAAPGRFSEGAGEEGIDEFAESVVSGLELAGLDIEAEGELGQQPEDHAGGLSEDTEAYFAGWDGPSGDEPGHPSQHDNEAAGHRTLSEIGLASATRSAAYPSHVSSKHDELADAVQSALMSVYGDPLGQPIPQVEESSDHGWGHKAKLTHDGNDQLSPQDVILNYFDYDPANGQRPSGASNGPYLAQGGHAWQQERAVQGHYRGQVPGQWRGPGAPGWSYDGPPTYPLPVAAARAKTGTRKERENGRLLGAAAIGLVVGLAIAASWAYFTITGAHVSTGAVSSGVEAQDSGYGRSVLEGNKVPGAMSADASSEIVAEDIVATTGQPAQLAISMKSQPSSDQALVNISGIPQGTRLSAGIDAGGGSWLLPPRRLNGLAINFPAGTPRTVPLEVQLLDSNARTPLSERKQFVVRVNPAKPDPAAFAATAEGASSGEAAPLDTSKSEQSATHVSSFDTQTSQAPAVLKQEPATPSLDSSFRTQTLPAFPAQQTAQPTFQASLLPTSPQAGRAASGPGAQKAGSQAEIEDLIREGNKRMREGDILEARQLYQKAIALGDAEAALAMGRSYDPIYFARIDKKNAEPDPAKAFDWYRKAMDAGAVQTAKVRIENLKHFLNE